MSMIKPGFFRAAVRRLVKLTELCENRRETLRRRFNADIPFTLLSLNQP